MTQLLQPVWNILTDLVASQKTEPAQPNSTSSNEEIKDSDSNEKENIMQIDHQNDEVPSSSSTSTEIDSVANADVQRNVNDEDNEMLDGDINEDDGEEEDEEEDDDDYDGFWCDDFDDDVAGALTVPITKRSDPINPFYYGFEKFKVMNHVPTTHKYYNDNFQPSNANEFSRAYQRDIKILNEGLPDGIFVKGFEERMNLFSALIMGPEGTPYEGGLFAFDILLPPSYPRKPPSFHFISYTSSRLNPNLYVEGTVCVSLLGTWRGTAPSENWSAESTLLQVLISIQGLILVAEPYFNEPGTELNKGSLSTIREVRQYNESVVLLQLQGLAAMLEKPPSPWEFEATFILKTTVPKLIERVESWLGSELPPFTLIPVERYGEFRPLFIALKKAHEKYINI